MIILKEENKQVCSPSSLSCIVLLEHAICSGGDTEYLYSRWQRFTDNPKVGYASEMVTKRLEADNKIRVLSPLQLWYMKITTWVEGVLMFYFSWFPGWFSIVPLSGGAAGSRGHQLTAQFADSRPRGGCGPVCHLGMLLNCCSAKALKVFLYVLKQF